MSIRPIVQDIQEIIKENGLNQGQFLSHLGMYLDGNLDSQSQNPLLQPHIERIGADIQSYAAKKGKDYKEIYSDINTGVMKNKEPSEIMKDIEDLVESAGQVLPIDPRNRHVDNIIGKDISEASSAGLLLILLNVLQDRSEAFFEREVLSKDGPIYKALHLIKQSGQNTAKSWFSKDEKITAPKLIQPDSTFEAMLKNLTGKKDTPFVYQYLTGQLNETPISGQMSFEEAKLGAFKELITKYQSELEKLSPEEHKNGIEFLARKTDLDIDQLIQVFKEATGDFNFKNGVPDIFEFKSDLANEPVKPENINPQEIFNNINKQLDKPVSDLLVEDTFKKQIDDNIDKIEQMDLKILEKQVKELSKRRKLDPIEMFKYVRSEIAKRQFMREIRRGNLTVERTTQLLKTLKNDSPIPLDLPKYFKEALNQLPKKEYQEFLRGEYCTYNGIPTTMGVAKIHDELKFDAINTFNNFNEIKAGQLLYEQTKNKDLTVEDAFTTLKLLKDDYNLPSSDKKVETILNCMNPQELNSLENLLVTNPNNVFVKEFNIDNTTLLQATDREQIIRLGLTPQPEPTPNLPTPEPTASKSHQDQLQNSQPTQEPTIPTPIQTQPQAPVSVQETTEPKLQQAEPKVETLNPNQTPTASRVTLDEHIKRGIERIKDMEYICISNDLPNETTVHAKNATFAEHMSAISSHVDKLPAKKQDELLYQISKETGMNYQVCEQMFEHGLKRRNPELAYQRQEQKQAAFEKKYSPDKPKDQSQSLA